MNKYYFDYAATTPVADKYLEVYNEISKKFYMNTQSDPITSDLAKQAQNKILELLNLNNNYEVIFTSGGTEANSLAILGRFKNEVNKKHFITSAIEHPSVLETFYELQRLGHEVEFINPQSNGIIKVEEVVNKVKKNTALISIMSVNNEIGTIQPINKIFTAVKKINTNIITMSDFVQAVGKIKIDFTNVDLGTFSGHKFYGAKGIGILIKKKKIVMEQIIYGSKISIRPGTQSLADQIAFVNVLQKAIETTEVNYKEIIKKQEYFINKLNKDKIKINGEQSIGVLNITLDIMAQSETVVEYLYDKGIIISTKSSCAVKLNKPSHVLQSVGLDDKQINRTIRISFSVKTTIEEIDYLIKELNIVVNKF